MILFMLLLKLCDVLFVLLFYVKCMMYAEFQAYCLVCDAQVCFSLVWNGDSLYSAYSNELSYVVA